MRKKLRNDEGFTLIEVIAVLIILAVVSAVAIMRGMGMDTARLQSETDTLKGHLRYAQYLAMNGNEGNVGTTSSIKWGILINGSAYTLIKDVGGVQTSPFYLPNESSATHTFSSGSGVTASVTAGNNPVLFNEWGSPNAATTISIGGQSITVTQTTGYIP